MPLIAVTGASGSLGVPVVAMLAARGATVVRFVRDVTTFSDQRYEIGDEPCLDGYDAVVHLAWAFLDRSDEEYERNVTGSIRLLDAASRSGVRMIFVSSVSAFAGQHSVYGHAKQVVERAVEYAGGSIVRPGLVVDEPPTGLAASLRRAAHRLPVLPLPMADNLRIWVVSRNTAARAICDAALDGVTSEIAADGPEPVTLRELGELVQSDRLATTPIIAVPRLISIALFWLVRQSGGKRSSLADSLDGLRFSQSSIPKQSASRVQAGTSSIVSAPGRDFDPDSTDRLDVHGEVFRSKPELLEVFDEIHHEFLRLEERFACCPRGSRVELGSGVHPLCRTDPDVISSEIISGSQVDLVFDGQAFPFSTGSLSAIFLQNVFHHFSRPERFFAEAKRVLVSGGVAILFEPYFSMGASLLYPRLFATEGFDKKMSGWNVTESGAMTGANQALSYIIFHRDRAKFGREFPTLEIVWESPFSNWPRYLASGGLNFRRILPRWSFPIMKAVEPRLGRAHSLLGLHHFVVLRKVKG